MKIDRCALAGAIVCVIFAAFLGRVATVIGLNRWEDVVLALLVSLSVGFISTIILCIYTGD